MTLQSQKVAESGMAIQAAGSVTVSTGMSPDQMAEIMVGLAKQLALYQADAERVVDERLERFRGDIIAEFARPGRANPEAFKDPDFQYLLARAQHAYARIGDKEVGETLVQMVADRSLCSDRNRLSLTLNQAVEVAAVLTINEFAELGLSFMLTQTIAQGVGNMDQFVAYFEKHISPLLQHISIEVSSYSYIVSQGCASIIAITSSDVINLLNNAYGGIFCDGFTQEDLKAHLSNDDEKLSLVKPYLIPCLNDSAKWQFRAQNAEQAKKMLEAEGLQLELAQNISALFENKMWQRARMIEKITQRLPDFSHLVDLWSKTPLRQMSLTALGTAIGHAYMHRVDPSFSANLSIWIK
jgi:hypothetical protein